MKSYCTGATAIGPNRRCAPYRALERRPSGRPDVRDRPWGQGRWHGSPAYADSHLFDIVLAFAVARLWPHVLSNAVDPGWVRTKMGGPSAPGGKEEGVATQVWLAVSEE